jgi:FMN phosphatase YigB (HAD superfamily)
MKYKQVVFDFGGVVIDFFPKELAAKFAQNEEEYEILIELMSHQDWLELDRGKYSFEEVARLNYERTGYPEKNTLEFFKFVRRGYVEISLTKQFILDLKKEGVEVYYLSNINVETLNYLFDNFPVFKEFKDGICSEKVGAVKPEKAIFDAFLDKTKLNKEDFIFLDDMEKNVNTAQSIGWNSVVYNKYNAKKVIESIFNS